MKFTKLISICFIVWISASQVIEARVKVSHSNRDVQKQKGNPGREPLIDLKKISEEISNEQTLPDGEEERITKEEMEINAENGKDKKMKEMYFLSFIAGVLSAWVRSVGAAYTILKDDTFKTGECSIDRWHDWYVKEEAERTQEMKTKLWGEYAEKDLTTISPEQMRRNCEDRKRDALLNYKNEIKNSKNKAKTEIISLKRLVKDVKRINCKRFAKNKGETFALGFVTRVRFYMNFIHRLYSCAMKSKGAKRKMITRGTLDLLSLASTVKKIIENAFTFGVVGIIRVMIFGGGIIKHLYYYVKKMKNKNYEEAQFNGGRALGLAVRTIVTIATAGLAGKK